MIVGARMIVGATNMPLPTPQILLLLSSVALPEFWRCDQTMPLAQMRSRRPTSEIKS